MTRILSAALALSLLSGAAVAQPYDPYDRSGDPQTRYQYQRTPGGYQYGPRWSRGDRLPSQYRQNDDIVRDWRQLGLRQPPRGYHWYRYDNSNYFLVATASGLIAETVYRDDRDQRWNQRYTRTYTYQDDSYYQQCRDKPDPAGVLIGALIGGLLGHSVGGDNRTATTTTGVIVGGVMGAALTGKLDCEDRSYAYRTYYDGFNSGRAGSRYQWRNPSNDHRGTFQVGQYYNDAGGFRCTTYSQTIYIQGRAQQARGHACRQPDGSWTVVD